MPVSTPDTELGFLNEAKSVAVTFSRTTGFDGIVSWTLPATVRHYDGVVILLATSEAAFTGLTDGNRYTASADIAAPADMVNGAQVVGAFYGDKLTTSVNVTGLDPAAVYYAAAYPVTNTRSYLAEGVFSFVRKVTAPVPGEVVSASSPPTSPTLGEVYYDTSDGFTYMWDGSAWIKNSNKTVPIAAAPPTTPVPVAGDFYYNNITKTLMVYTGAAWIAANVDLKGSVPMYDKTGIGHDGSSDEYERMINIVKTYLGYPQVCVELTPAHFKIALDNALGELRRLSDVAYRQAHFIMRVKPGQRKYFLNDPSVGTNKIVNVVKIYRSNNFGFILAGDNGIYGQMIANQFYSAGFADLTSVHLLAQYAERVRDIFAQELSFTWDEYTRQLEIFKRVVSDEGVVLECTVERTDNELLFDRWTTKWLQAWAIAECKEMLGLIRSKYGSLPGAGGGVTLNGESLLQQAKDEFLELKRQITDFEVGNGAAYNYSITMG